VIVLVLPGVAAAVAHFVAMEVLGIHMATLLRMVSPLGVRAAISVLRMEMVIYMAPEFVVAVIPRACADERRGLAAGACNAFLTERIGRGTGFRQRRRYNAPLNRTPWGPSTRGG